MIANTHINLEIEDVRKKPFPYFVTEGVLNKQSSLRLLEWLETEAPWKLVVKDFYEQYEFDAAQAEMPADLQFLCDLTFIGDLTGRFEKLFSVSLASLIDITAHKLVRGQTIRMHNDFVPGQETHRLLIQVNRDWRDENGGFLLLFNSEDPSDVHRVIRPLHNSATGFAISPESNHAVSTIHSGERYTLVYSFYAATDYVHQYRTGDHENRTPSA